jgi:DNA-binding transcriptional LysR family regulator
MADRLSPDGLRYAQAVAETGSFSAAARAHGVTQPALSTAIAKLEERLGGRLFDRSARGVTRTAFGARILPLVERATSALDAVLAEAARWAGAGGAVIRLGVSPLIDPALVAGVYTAVCGPAAGPGPRRLVLSGANVAELRAGLRAGELDLVLIPAVAPLPRFEQRVISAEPVVVVAPGVPGDGPVDVHELAGRPLVLMPDTCGLTAFTRDLFRSRGLTERVHPGAAVSYRVLAEWSDQGLGSAVIPRSKLAGAGARHRPLVDGGTAVEIRYAAVWDPRSALAADLEALADRLAEPG